MIGIITSCTGGFPEAFPVHGLFQSLSPHPDKCRAEVQTNMIKWRVIMATELCEKFGKQGLTFDDVLLIPAESDADSQTCHGRPLRL